MKKKEKKYGKEIYKKVISNPHYKMNLITLHPL